MRLAILLPLPLALFGAGARAESQRPQTAIDPAPIAACEGEFDTPPTLLRGKRPVWPASTLSPGWIEDREIRRLPMVWDVTATFRVDARGRPRDVRSTVTDPPSFARHTNAAINEWRFTPAMRGGGPVDALCTFNMTFDLR